MKREDAFEDYLKKVEVGYEKIAIDGGIIFKFQQQLDHDTNLVLGAIFNNEGTIADIQVNNIFTIENDRNKYLELLNKLNDEYRYIKFTLLDDKQIIAKYSIILDGDFNYSKIIFDSLIMAMNTVKDCIEEIKTM